MFIRYFADTTGSDASIVALEYMRALMRIAPVRLITVTGPLAGRWMGYGQLLTTPMLGGFVNCVACDPSRWTWQQRVEASSRPVLPGDLAAGKELTAPASTETIVGNVGLYTSGVRNVLFVIARPRSKREIDASRQYEAIVLPSIAADDIWRGWFVPHVIPVPVVGDDIARLRGIVNE